MRTAFDSCARQFLERPPRVVVSEPPFCDLTNLPREIPHTSQSLVCGADRDVRAPGFGSVADHSFVCVLCGLFAAFRHVLIVSETADNRFRCEPKQDFDFKLPPSRFALL